MGDTESIYDSWEMYPDVEPLCYTFDCDSRFYTRRFNEDAARLFSRQGDHLISYCTSVGTVGSARGIVPYSRKLIQTLSYLPIRLYLDP